MFAVADLKVTAPADRRVRIDQVGGVEQAGAVLALVTACRLVPTVGTSANHVPIRQEAAFLSGVELLDNPLFDQPLISEPVAEVLGELAVLERGAAAEVVE